jgi:hypothetical protein
MTMLSPRLSKAARNLEERFDCLKAPTRKLSNEQWNTVPEVRDLVPPWLRELLSSYRLLDGVLEYRDRSQPFVRFFRFFDDVQFTICLREATSAKGLWDYNYLPFAHESDGSLWVLSKGEESGPIFLLDYSAWDGREPTSCNGLIFAASRLDLLLLSMGISEVSYYDLERHPHSVIWYKADEEA